jgi:hypothetical protein
VTQPGECDFSLLTDWAKQKVAVKGAVGAREIRPSGWSVAYSELSQRLAASVFRLNKRVTVEKSPLRSLTGF